MENSQEKWIMPDWMKEYLPYMEGFVYEDFMNTSPEEARKLKGNERIFVTSCCVACSAVVGTLTRLYNAGMLKHPDDVNYPDPDWDGHE